MLSERKNPGVTRVFCCLLQKAEILFVGAAAGFDAGSGRGKKCSCRADDSEDGGWILWRMVATALCVEREGDREQESEAKELQGGLLHGWSPSGKVSTQWG